jgi:outer membrane receptor for ferrienterochelin and colicin
LIDPAGGWLLPDSGSARITDVAVTTAALRTRASEPRAIRTYELGRRAIMRLKRACISLLAFLVFTQLGWATIFGNVRGIVHDPQHRPISGAEVTIHALASAWSRQAQTDASGEFQFSNVPLGQYTVTASAPGFQVLEQTVEVTAGSAPVLHFPLALATQTEKVEVVAPAGSANTVASATATTLSRKDISETPGADRTNSLALITDYLPGAVMVHDQLHVRGGHQVSWLVDGVPVPNTNIASNVGPQFDPKDIDYIEMQSGGYSAEYGDRTYGVFNVVPRTGFERNNEAELVASYGNFNETNDQLSFGSHTERWAYYGSVNASRTDLGLATPSSSVIHDLASGVGGFGSLIYNATPSDQLRFVMSLRKDHYQIPNTPEGQAAGFRDLDRESDAFANVSWVHTFSPATTLRVSPFYHFNRADFAGWPGDPIVTNDNRASSYFGLQGTLSAVAGRHNARGGFQVLGQRDHTRFGLQSGNLSLSQQQNASGNAEVLFLEDEFRPASWLTLNGGLRLTRFAGLLTEHQADPRVGAAILIPRLHWVLRGYYARYYQPPPLDTVSGPLLELAVQEGFGFLPLHGERDEQHDLGLTVPWRGWNLDIDNFRTGARNFFDHDVLGNSNLFLPLTIQEARLRGWEAVLRTPQVLGRADLHLAFSHQYAEGKGAVTGGLTDFSPPPCCYFFLDHDQRHTLSGVLRLRLPWRSWSTAAVQYGSGFLDGNGPGHLPAHTTVDLSVGKALGEDWSVAFTALNLANRRFLIDNSNTFGGTHYAYPRQLAVEIRYRFHY